MEKLVKSTKAIINRARALGVEYEAQYRGCGQCTFLAVVDALRWGGREIVPGDLAEKFFSAVGGFTGGTSMVIDGTCGALNAGILVMGLALGPARQSQDELSLRILCAAIRNHLLDKFYRKYDSILCRDILNKYFGKVWNLADDQASNDFLQVSHGCAILQTVMWTTEIILNEM